MFKFGKKRSDKLGSMAQDHTKVSFFILVAMYFLLDYMMMENARDMDLLLTIIFFILAVTSLYTFYVVDYVKGRQPMGVTDIPAFMRDKKRDAVRKRYVIVGWLAIMVWGIIFLICEPLVVPKFFFMVDSTYYPAQIVLMLFIAPVMEEVTFRYLLYDRWLKQKWGWFWGFMAASFIFVICHPVTNIHALVIYWIPTVLFFLVYQEFGLYGSIVVHMLYNMMAI